MNLCLRCGKETKNVKFCSQSCSTRYNNAKRPKKKYFCTKCKEYLGEGYVYKRTKLCEKCNPNIVDWDNLTFDEIKQQRKYQKYSRIRTLARNKAMKETRFQNCACCGYDKHIEVCHIKAINSFSGETKISEINDLSNLIGLCPNCHWEFDQGLLEFDSEWLE